MDIIDRAREIDGMCKELKDLESVLPVLASKRAVTIGRYAVDLRVAIITLKSKGETATLAPKLAEGLCHDSLVAKEEAEGCYQVARARQRSIETRLSGSQSVFRHLSHT